MTLIKNGRMWLGPVSAARRGRPDGVAGSIFSVAQRQRYRNVVIENSLTWATCAAPECVREMSFWPLWRAQDIATASVANRSQELISKMSFWRKWRTVLVRIQEAVQLVERA